MEVVNQEARLQVSSPRKRAGVGDGEGPRAKVQRSGMFCAMFTDHVTNSDLEDKQAKGVKADRFQGQRQGGFWAAVTKRQPFGAMNFVDDPPHGSVAAKPCAAGPRERRHSFQVSMGRASVSQEAIMRDSVRTVNKRPSGTYMGAQPIRKKPAIQPIRRRHTVTEDTVTGVDLPDEKENMVAMWEQDGARFGGVDDCRQQRRGSKAPGLRLHQKEPWNVTLPGLLTFPNLVLKEGELLETSILEAVNDIEVKDGLHAAEYAEEICSYLRDLEKRDLHSPTFLEKNCEIKPRMREILVDWLIQVQYHLSLHQETLYFAVRVLDRVLERRHVAVTQLQLLGVAALWIGTKIEEYEPADVEELLHLTMDSYTVQQMLVMERSVLKCLNFELAVAEPMVFLNKFIQVAGEEWNKKVLNVATYSIDILLPNIRFVAFPSSYLAAAALYVGILVQSCSTTQWTGTLQHHTGYTEDEVLPVVIEMLTALKVTAEGKSELDGAFLKYCSRSKYEGVAQSMELAPGRLDRLLQFMLLLEGISQ